MNKFLLTSLITTTLLASTASFAAVCSQPSSDGNLTCNEGSLSSLHVEGNAMLNRVTVHGQSKVEGKLDASESRFQALTVESDATFEESNVNGSASIEGNLSSSRTTFHKLKVEGNAYFDESKVKGDMLVEGKLAADESTLEGDTTVETSQVILNESHANHLTIKAKDSNPYLCLKGHSKVEKVDFSQSAGTVYLNGNSSKAYSIINGKRVSGSCPNS